MKPEILEGFSWNEPSPIDHDGFHNRSVDLAVKLFNDKPAEETLLGIFVFAGTGGFTVVIRLAWNGPVEKDMAAASLRSMLRHPIIEAYSFITEAWMAKARADEPLKDMPPPSQHPDREDVLNIWTTLRDGTTKMTRFGVKIYPAPLPFLPPTKKPRLLERDDHILEGSGEMTGRMFNFFESEEESKKRMKKAERKHKRAQKKEKSNDNG